MRVVFYTLSFLASASSGFSQHSKIWREMERDRDIRRLDDQRMIEDQMRRQDMNKLLRSMEERDTSPIYVPVPVPVPQAPPVAPPIDPSRAPGSTKEVAEIMAVDGSTGKLYPVTSENILIVSQNEMAKTWSPGEFEAAVDKSQAKAVKMIPQILDKNHPIHAKAEEIWAAAEKNNGPLITVSDAPWIVYYYAAKDLGIPITPPAE